MLGELNSAGISTLKAVGNTADGVKELAGWFKNEVKDAATLAKELNEETREIRKSIAKQDFITELKNKQYKTAKAEAKIDAKLASSGLKLDITAGE